MSPGEVFKDATVARLYGRRPPHPEAVFAMLRRRLVAPRTVLDAGAGTGALARGMVSFAERVDAVEPSAAMIEEARSIPGADDRRIRWIPRRAEDAPLSPPYGLIACGLSIHWMDLPVVLPRFRDALAPGARLAIVNNESVHGPYEDDLWAVTARYATAPYRDNTAHAIEAMRASGVFTIEDEERTDPVPFEQSVEGFIERLHSGSTLTRAELGDGSEKFDGEIRAVFARHGFERLRYGVIGKVTWAAPVIAGASGVAGRRG
jgi:SAM-dependent methyltransferase